MFDDILFLLKEALSFDDLDNAQLLLDFIELPSVHSILSDYQYNYLRSFQNDINTLKDSENAGV